MTDILDRLARLDGSTDIPDQAVLRGDLSRGESALSRRRRTRTAVAGAALTVALGAGLAVPTALAEDHTSSDTSRPDVALVSWNGTQPEGFKVDKVPEGFFVQGSDAHVFTIAPDGDTTHPLAFPGKLVVMLQDPAAVGVDLGGEPVDVGDVRGTIRDTNGATIVEFPQNGHEVVVQMADSVGLDDQQLVAFAAGVTVTSKVEGPEVNEREVKTTVIWRNGRKYLKVEPQPSNGD